MPHLTQPFQIRVLSLEETEEALLAEKWDLAISIGDPAIHGESFAEEPPPGLPPNSLRLLFHDISRPFAGYQMPSQEDVEAIAKFATHIRPEMRVLCHCYAGISRSTAAALISYLRHLPKTQGGVDAALEWVLKDRPIACPNSAMIQMADQLFGLGGRLTQSVRQIRRV